MFWRPFARVDRVLPVDADKSELSPGFCYSTPISSEHRVGVSDSQTPHVENEDLEGGCQKD